MSTTQTRIPARLDRLSWSRFHTLVVVALGATWILDGLEVTLAGSVAGALQASPTLHLSATQIGLSASAYLAGAVGGALLFGWWADRAGRKKLFNITLGLYLLATAATAFSTNFYTFALFRALTGAGIGGEYAAINSAIGELIPARFRGRTDLAINGSFWIGAALGAIGALTLLAPSRFGPDLGWRLTFGIGAALGLIVLSLRKFVPESPRWLMTHGRLDEAEAICTAIEQRCGEATPSADLRCVQLTTRTTTLADVARSLFRVYPRRTAVGLILMSAQAFFYNAIFFTYALVLSQFFHIQSAAIGWYILPFAAGNFLGPLVLGPWFDKIGRKPMISATYALSGVLLLVTAGLFACDLLTAVTQTLAWSVVFFVASAAASSAYLTVGESFPLELRALAIALFYAFGTALGGIAGPWVFGVLIGSGARGAVAAGYAFGATLMLVAACVQWRFGLAAEGRSLEDVAPPLSQAANSCA